MIERDVKRPLRKLLEEIGAYQFWPVPTGFGARTIDVLFCWQGRFYGVETKRPGVEQATVAQNRVMSLIQSAGGRTCIENNPELPAVKRMLGLDGHCSHCGREEKDVRSCGVGGCPLGAEL